MNRRSSFHPITLFLLLLVTARMCAADEGLELVRDGVSEYRICIPDSASPRTIAAAETLRFYLREISGADIPVVLSTEHPGKRIVFEIGCSIDNNMNTGTLGDDGFRIRTIHSYLFLTAHTDRGIQNAVYTFLESYLGCRKYSTSVERVPHAPTIVLPPLDDTQVPRLTFRFQDFRDSAYSAWHKQSSLDEWGLFVHTFKTLVPPEKYFKDHPEYFSENNGVRVADGQLCLSNPDVYRIVVDELRRRMKDNPQARFWSVSQNDTYVPCRCSNCSAFDSIEGSPSGSILGFTNLVADEFPGKTISTLAYQYSRAAPAHIKPAPNVNIMLCSIECNRSRPIADDPSSASFVKDVRDWSRLTNNIFLWDYVIQFRNLVSPFPNLRVLQPNLQFFVENGISQVFEQGVATMHGEFAELRAYLIAKLLWNPYLNVDSVMTDFLQGYYGDAAPFVRKYIDTMHDALARSGEELSIYGYPYPSENGYLSAGMIEEYETIFDEAERAVAKQPDFLVRVQTARLPVQYARLEQAKMLGFAERGFFERGVDGAAFAKPELEDLLQVFVERCRRAGTIRLWEHGTSPDEYLVSTQRFIDEALEPHLALGGPVTLAIPASRKYHNGEAGALTDGLKGWTDYHFHWLGFEGDDMDAVVDLGEVKAISRIETDFLQDILSWVFMPTAVEFLLSEDGADYQSVGIVRDTIPAERSGAIIAPYNVQFQPTRARFVRVKATSLKTCPAWHKGAGGKAWIFIDEIKVF
jgi:hypothetical protein